MYWTCKPPFQLRKEQEKNVLIKGKLIEGRIETFPARMFL